jgi:hypothetical protein
MKSRPKNDANVKGGLFEGGASLREDDGEVNVTEVVNMTEVL